MACCLFSINTWSELMFIYCQLNPKERTSMKYKKTIWKFRLKMHLKEMSTKYLPFCSGLNIFIYDILYIGICVIWKCFLYLWTSVWGNQCSQLDSLHKGPVIQISNHFSFDCLNKLLNKCRDLVKWNTLTLMWHHCNIFVENSSSYHVCVLCTPLKYNHSCIFSFPVTSGCHNTSELLNKTWYNQGLWRIHTKTQLC